MFGWELPPIFAGGIGMVCYDLIKSLSAQDVEITYVMPFGPQNFQSELDTNVIIAENVVPTIKNVQVKVVKTLFKAYQTPAEYEVSYKQVNAGQELTDIGPKKKRTKLYGEDLFTEVDYFAKRAFELAVNIEFDVVHAHDWMTFPAATAAADRAKKPLVVHIHNTVYDRYLGNFSEHERDIEYNGMARADTVIAISQYVKDMIINKYGIDPNKIEVVHNAPNTMYDPNEAHEPLNFGGNKMVLYAGRVTGQKGPEYFIQTAKRICDVRDNVMFVMAGTGDLQKKCIDMANDQGIGHKMLFTGFFTPQEGKQLFGSADCFVMPSVSEPFGIVPMESMLKGTPAVISKTSGCAEVLSHTLKADFWDIDHMANQIVSVLDHPCLKESLSENGFKQVSVMNWEKPAKQCIDVYNKVRN
ncbi:MAG: glycogen(starch) synthase [Candidatus Woesearchaeota archaeon]|jgi:glycogen(starch) synthase